MPRYHVIIHSPGPAWQRGVPFREQPNVGLHAAFMRSLEERGLMPIGGPFLDDEGGGMAVVATETPEEAEALAREDPSVANGLLTFRVRPWHAIMGTLTEDPPRGRSGT